MFKFNDAIVLLKKWFFDRLYNQYFVQNIKKLSHFFTYQEMDRGFLEQMGPLNLVYTLKTIVNRTLLIYNHSFVFYLYALLFVTSTIFLIIFFEIFFSKISLILIFFLIIFYLFEFDF